ncbi:cub and zona pellucida-like domain-containing protein 1 [Plakobranchus ocellatus]|uniref:Cub and zona pellucida-like domain-containing protein 1 n=1 Tax=Plakobranchus ocellatus TaxID=259542 RepID=A0AAV4CDA9_9GAST|nr:cub and zona pellucida-like domain-containing protein 1 [Plakobranchus ocellatus]
MAVARGAVTHYNSISNNAISHLHVHSNSNSSSSNKNDNVDDDDGNKNNQFCEITFESYYNGDGVKLVFDRVDLEPPRLSGDYSTCQDKIVVYDGPSYSDPLLTTLCGMRTVTLESKDSSLLLVFSSDGYKNGAHLGFSVSYSSIDRGGSDSASGVGAGTLVAIILPCLFIYALLFFVVYKRCKYAQRVQQCDLVSKLSTLVTLL